MPVEIPMPKFYRNKQIEREKIQEQRKELKEKMASMKLQEKSEFKGMRDPKVSIDDTNIDLYDTPQNVS